ncbi:MAG: 2,3-bisphosphoglycerate-independent phosphoglycerate mutase [Candidatus Babeliales bacterium]
MSNKISRPLVLVILDGFGFSTAGSGNATVSASMPAWNSFTKSYPWILLNASGPHVGLLPGYIGNSEVGHLTIGSGRVVESMLKRFHDAIADQSFFSHPVLLQRFKELKETGKTLHLMGIVSDGGVHGHINHLFALMTLAKRVGLEKVMIHAFLDGRDVAPQSASNFLSRIEEKCNELGCGQLASIHGRFYAMDRDKNWERTQASYNVLCAPSSDREPQSWREIIKQSYARNIYDEFVVPTRLIPDSQIASGDGIVFFNFRPDRARQLTESFINMHFDHFTQQPDLVAGHGLAWIVTTTLFDNQFSQWCNNDIIFEREEVSHTLLDEIAEQSKGQMATFVLAETEKYAHVTYFFRGMVDKQLSNEMRMIIASQKANNYVSIPEMSAKQISKQAGLAFEENKADVYVINYANADMVGHAGNLQATIAACEVIDRQLAYLYEEVVGRRGGTLIITADHGNAEEQIDHVSGKSHTAHTTNPVPFIIITPQRTNLFTKSVMPYVITDAWRDACTKHCPLSVSLGLSSIAPTMLTYLGFSIPSVMNKESLI